MTWCEAAHNRSINLENQASSQSIITTKKHQGCSTTSCPSCGNNFPIKEKPALRDLPGLPAGVKFDPTDRELLEHLEGKARLEVHKLHPLIDEFIPTIEGENGICYTHPERLPGVRRDGMIRHFFHRPSKAYTTGTRKRRKVQSEEEGGETRWHKTGKTRPIFSGGGGGGERVKGYKKILVLYTNYGKERKPEKTSWVMHQYHLGSDEEEKDGELVVSKVFYQTHPRQCASASSSADADAAPSKDALVFRTARNYMNLNNNENGDGGGGREMDFYHPSLMPYNHGN